VLRQLPQYSIILPIALFRLPIEPKDYSPNLEAEDEGKMNY
jgi:hypothetical protein